MKPDDLPRTRTVFMFSGQGSQYFHMGRWLHDNHAPFRACLRELDAFYAASFGTRVLEALFDPQRKASEAFDRTALSHPAIVMIEYALARSLIDEGIEPDLVLGASLGTFTAAAVVGAMSIHDALRATHAHAQAIERDCEPGGMVAVLAPPALFDEAFLRGASELAAVNFDGHFVVSAPAAACAAIERELVRREIACQRVAVSFAFHSRWIDAGRGGFEQAVRGLALAPCSRPLVCCDLAVPLARLHPGQFWDVTRHPIRFPAAVARLEKDGPCRYLDLGPSGTLATFLRYLLPAGSASTALPVLTPYGQEARNWAQALALRDGAVS